MLYLRGRVALTLPPRRALSKPIGNRRITDEDCRSGADAQPTPDRLRLKPLGDFDNEPKLLLRSRRRLHGEINASQSRFRKEGGA